MDKMLLKYLKYLHICATLYQSRHNNVDNRRRKIANIFGIFENSCIRAGTTGTMLLMHLQGRDSGSALQEARFVGFGLFGLIPATLHVVVFLALSNNHLVFLVLSMSMHFISPLHLSQCHSFHFPSPPSFSHSCSEDPFSSFSWILFHL